MNQPLETHGWAVKILHVPTGKWSIQWSTLAEGKPRSLWQISRKKEMRP
jgi:hypothetical protein